MRQYLKLLLHRAFAGSVLLTDKMSIVAGVLIPAVLHVSDAGAMANTILGIVSWAIIIAVGGAVLLRLVTAPYFLWRQDQATIAHLNDALVDPLRREVEYLDQSVLDHRAALAENLTTYAVGLLNAHDSERYRTQYVRENLTLSASLFLGDPFFRWAWDFFYSHIAHVEVSDALLLPDDSYDVPTAEQIMAVPLCNFHAEAANVCAYVLVQWLRHAASVQLFDDSYGAVLEKHLPWVGAHADPFIAAFRPPQLPPGMEDETQP